MVEAFEEALITDYQMQVSGYRPRTLKDYDTVLSNFAKTIAVTYLEDITVETIYLWLNDMLIQCNYKIRKHYGVRIR